MQGKILKAIAGFYYVYVVGSGLYECKARGIFRRENRSPLVGDNVRIDVISTAEMTGNIVDIEPRKNELKRPPVANIDQALILFSMRTPDPNLLLLDRFLISAGQSGIPCVICFNKADLASSEEIEEIGEAYRECGAPLYFISVKNGSGLDQVRHILSGKTTALAGPSGAGKSSLTNAVQGRVRMEVGDISKKLARGRNTTRHSELICVEDGTFLCDTPGFTALDTGGIGKEELENCYPEFRPYIGSCYYQGCAHISEPDCAVKDALCRKRISPLRYGHYRYLYEELKEEERRKYR